MNIIILGPQGSGKGTQAELLADKFKLHYVDMGKIMRSIAESDNKYAAEINNLMTKGELVPDDLVRVIAWDYISKHDKETGFLFDGYPRSVPQYEYLKEMLLQYGKKLDRVIYLDIPEEETIKRLSSRRTCEKCGKIYNLITNPPSTPDKCEECGGKLEQREDDSPEAIKERLKLFQEKTIPVLKDAEEDGILVKINGVGKIEDIHKEIVNTLGL
jgi:adenylate kinase